MDVKRWHGGGHPEYALDGIEKLCNGDLTSLGLDDMYYDAILELHEQIMTSTPRQEERMDDRCFGDAWATWAAHKHPAWDHLIDTSPEGWMEFYKSFCCNALPFLFPWFHLKASICRTTERGMAFASAAWASAGTVLWAVHCLQSCRL